MKNNNKGITLLELIVAFSIAAVLALAVVPNLTQYIGFSSKGTCEASRLEFMRSYQTYLATGEGNGTLAQALNGQVPELLADSNNLRCSDGGIFAVVDGSIVCSVHGAIGAEAGDDPGGSGGSGPGGEWISGDVIFGTPLTHEVVLDSWTAERASVITYCEDNPYESGMTLSNLSKGSVLVYEGKTYLAKWGSPWLTEADAIEFEKNPSAISFLFEFDPTHVINSSAYNTSTGWSPHLMNGDVFYENGVAYVYLGVSDKQWESLPQNGGYWIKLV
ncbi:MAG: hypothetical protein CVU91_02960 [Firmicutes bacterium HGW-Firmicutes-16]|nr:MAG: hypothetical protein CVU91_02960 [Firmicutes bacterium HGW-Firmicutes-16]